MTSGIHHITAIASDAQQNVDFYTHILGLRLVKKTVNQDDVSTYHLFFGDKSGEPGMDLTFFIFQPAILGKRGNGLVTKISFAVPVESIDFWKKRFETLGVTYAEQDRNRVVFYDQDDQQLELVGVSSELFDDSKNVWTTAEISRKNAIRCFYSASLSVADLTQMEPILIDVFGYTVQNRKGQSSFYALENSKRAHILEVIEDTTQSMGVNAAGTVHHIAFRAKDEKEQMLLTYRVMSLGLQPTHVIDRFYFKSVYFRTPSGILFEIATDGPGFTADESLMELGKKLALPPFLEPQRSEIEKNLTPITLK